MLKKEYVQKEILLPTLKIALDREHITKQEFEILSYLVKKEDMAIYGSRGIGKTTTLMQLLQSSDLPNSSKLYISCDHAMFQDVSLFDFVDEFSKRGGELICIDEVHEASNFEKELKSIYDFLDIKVYFTGSSALHLTNPDFVRR